MSGTLEHLRFLLENDVFPARLLIGVMNQKYFHKMLLPFSIELGLEVRDSPSPVQEGKASRNAEDRLGFTFAGISPSSGRGYALS